MFPRVALLSVLSLGLAVGCMVEGEPFEKAFEADPNAMPAPAAPAEDDDEADEDDDDVDPDPDDADVDLDDHQPKPAMFGHAGKWTGSCTLTDRESFQVDLQLDKHGKGFLRRHDVGPVELDAEGMTDEEGTSIVLAVRAGVVFRVHMYAAEGGEVDAECLELVESEGEGDGLDCMFPSVGCPTEERSYSVVASGELTLTKTG